MTEIKNKYFQINAIQSSTYDDKSELFNAWGMIVILRYVSNTSRAKLNMYIALIDGNSAVCETIH